MNVIEIDAPDFDLAKTLDSGQVFHWEKINAPSRGYGVAGNGFVGTIGDVPAYVEQVGGTLRAKVASASSRCGQRHGHDAHATIHKYFALDHPLAEICATFPSDPIMNAARDFCRGLRIMRQPKWECLAMFICSSMKQVAHIRQISRALRERFGEPSKLTFQDSIQNRQGGSTAPRTMLIDSASPTFVNIEVRAGPALRTARSTNKHTVYTFPTAGRLAQSSEQELRECALGYRAKNLLGTARLVANGEVDLGQIAALSDVDLRARLCQLPGVGAKVANCVMLFAYERLRAFPIDVWIERVLRENYFPRTPKLNASRLQVFTQEYFGEHGGYAQQYLFHHARKSRKRAIPVNRPCLRGNKGKGRGGSPESSEKGRSFVTPSRLR